MGGRPARVEDLPPVPEYEAYVHNTCPRRHDRILDSAMEALNYWPQSSNLNTSTASEPPPSPLQFFMLFFTKEIFTHLADATKAYAAQKQGLPSTDTARRAWTWSLNPPCRGQMMIFIALMIYMGIYKSSSVGEYWTKDDRKPLHR